MNSTLLHLRNYNDLARNASFQQWIDKNSRGMLRGFLQRWWIAVPWRQKQDWYLRSGQSVSCKAAGYSPYWWDSCSDTCHPNFLQNNLPVANVPAMNAPIHQRCQAYWSQVVLAPPHVQVTVDLGPPCIGGTWTTRDPRDAATWRESRWNDGGWMPPSTPPKVGNMLRIHPSTRLKRWGDDEILVWNGAVSTF